MKWYGGGLVILKQNDRAFIVPWRSNINERKVEKRLQ